MGLYLSAHPLDEYTAQLTPLNITRASQIDEAVEKAGGNTNLHFAGLVTGKRIRMSVHNKRYAFLQVSDPSGVIEFTLFSKLFESVESILTDNVPIYIKAEAQAEGGRIKLLAQEILPLETAINEKMRALMIHVLDASALEGIAEGLKRAGTDGRNCY